MKILLLVSTILLSSLTIINAQWEVIHISKELSQGYNDITVNNNIVLVGGGELLRSSDLGDTWSTINLPNNGEIGKIYFTSTSKVIMTVFNVEDSIQYILRSEDAGLNWITLHALEKRYISNFQMIDENKGYFLSDDIMYSTTNGGKSLDSLLIYEQLTLRAGLFNSFSFINEMEGHLISSGRGNNNRFIYEILKTNDGGKQWQRIHTLGFSDCIADHPLFYSLGDSIGFLSCNNNPLKRSIDGYIMFFQVLNPRFRQTMRDLSFSSSSFGYVVGGFTGYIGSSTHLYSLMAKSHNQGENWKIELDSFGIPLTSVEFINDSVGFVVGSNFNLIMKTVNGGGKIIGDYPWNELEKLRVANIETDKNHGELNISPNPTSGITYIKSTFERRIKKWSIYNIAGQLIHSKSIQSSNELKLDLTKFEEGVYYIILNLEDGTNISTKVLKI